LGLKYNPSPDPAQCGKPTALGTHSKHYESRKAKTTYILEWREYILAADIMGSDMMLGLVSVFLE